MDADTARLEAWLNTTNGRHATELARELVKTLAVDNMMGVTINGIGHVGSLLSKLLHTSTALSTERAQKKEIGERLLAAESRLGEYEKRFDRQGMDNVEIGLKLADAVSRLSTMHIERDEFMARVRDLTRDLAAAQDRLDTSEQGRELAATECEQLRDEVITLGSRLGAATKLIKKVWEYDVVTEGGLLPQDLEREIEAFVIPAVVENQETRKCTVCGEELTGMHFHNNTFASE